MPRSRPRRLQIGAATFTCSIRQTAPGEVAATMFAAYGDGWALLEAAVLPVDSGADDAVPT